MKYSYLIYKIYHWTANKKGSTPLANTVLTLGVVHGLQFYTVLLYLNAFFLHSKKLFDFHMGYVWAAAIGWFMLLYFLLYNKARWDCWVKQYQSENEHESKVGDYKAMAFCVFSALAFFVSLPVSFTINNCFK